MVLFWRDGVAVLRGRRHLGHQQAGGLGLRHHQLRLVDRHRPRRHADLRHSAAAAPGVAHLDQPLRRGDDASSRWPAPACSRCIHSAARGSLYWLLPYPNTMGMWPQFRSPLIWDVFAVTTYATVSLLFWYVGPGPRPGHPARPRAARSRAKILYGCWHGLARLGPALARATRRPTCCSPGWRRRWWSRCTRSCQLRLRRRHRPRLALDDLPALLRRRRHLRRLRHGAHAAPSRCARSRPRGLHHRAAPGEHGAR